MTKFFKKISALLLPLVGGWGAVYAQSVGDFRTNGAVTFAAATNWQTYNGTAWVAAAAAPTSADGAILINGPHTAQVTTNVTLDQVSVDGILQINNGATLTLADGTGDDLFVRNRLFFQATGVISGAGALVLGNQAIVQTANVGGLAASITSTNPTLTAGASYWFNGATAQSTGFTGFASLGNPLHFHFKNTAGITIDRNLTITGTLTANNNVPITIGAGVTSFTANAIYNGGSFNNCVGATISPAFTDTGWASPKGVYQSPDSSEPTTESTNIWTNSHKTTAHIYWMQSGSGNNRIVVLKAGSAVSPTAAIDNTTYSANAAFGTGTAIDGGFVVYNGAGSQVNVTGLTEGTTYHVAVFEYNQDCGTNRNYKTGTPLTTSFVAEERPFITEWITTDGTLTIPTFTGETYNYTVSYRELPTGLPTVLTGQTGNCTITDLTNGSTYEISITGTFPRIYFYDAATTEKDKIRNIKQWGSIRWTSMQSAFGNNQPPYTGCANLNSNTTDVPNLSNVATMEEMFYGCSVFNGGNIANWNTQNIINTTWMFNGATAFNQNISYWNTQKVVDMSYMLRLTSVFNQNIGIWNTQNVTNMSNLLRFATIFNQPIGSWNTQNVTDMNSLISNDFVFNQNIGNLNTQNVNNMAGMFEGTSTFNQDLSSWNTMSVVNMFSMFYNATAFNQSLANWNITNLSAGVYPGAYQMFNYCGMNTANYDATLIGWAAQNVKTGVQLGATGLRYCAGVAARNSLIISKGWTILGDALGTCPTISGFTPTGAGVDATITLTGTNFTGTTAVSIGGQPARSFCVVNATTIKAVTNDNIANGDIVITNGATATLNGFVAAIVPNGTITGTNFVSAGGFTVLRVAITPASPTQWRQALRYREVGAPTWSNLTFDGGAISADIQGVTTNKQYEIYLQTVSSAGQWSNRSAITTSANSGTATFCSPTVASAAGIAGTTVTFNWTAQANATRYLIRYWEMAAPQGTCAAEQIAGSNKTVYVENGATNNIVVQGLKPNTNYAYDVQVYCGSAVVTNRSNVITFTTGAGTACAVPSTVNFGQTTVSGYPAFNVTWSGATGVTSGSPKYQLRYKTNASTNWIYWNTDATSYVMSGLEPNTQYNFQIAVFCSGTGGNVEWSSVYTTTSGAGTACNNVTLGTSTPFSAVGGVVGANLVWTGDAITAGRRFFLGYTKDGESFTVWRWIESNGVTVRSDLDFPNLLPSSNYTYDLQTYCNTWNFAGYAIGNPGSFTTGAATSASPLTELSYHPEGGIADKNLSVNELVIYPNPSEGEVNIAYQTTQQNGVALTVIDVLGREVYSQSFNGSVSMKLDGKTLPSGVYVAKVTENGKVMTKRFVVK